MDQLVRKDHRRELYSPASPDAASVAEAFGPDGVRVTFRVEPAIDRFRRWRFLFFTPPVLTDPARAYVGYRVLPDLVQRHLLRDRWAVDVEADTGERLWVRSTSRDAAIAAAGEIRVGVLREGVAFLRRVR